MAVQQAVAFEVNPGGRDALLAAIAQVKAIDEQAGASTRVAGVTAGPNVGSITVSTTHASWESLAEFLEKNPTRAQPVLDLLRSATPPARLTANTVRAEVLARDSDGLDLPAFTSALIFDPGSGTAAQATEALGATRDLFETLGSVSRIWTLANGPNLGRVAIASGFDNLAGWARFRARLTEHTEAGNALPVAPFMADGTIRIGGLIQTTAIDL
jgi:hypothetical protein